MATKLYLHIGHSKCGSSTLQQALYDNRLALHDLGIGVVDDKFELMKSSSRHRFPLSYFRCIHTTLLELEGDAREEYKSRMYKDLDGKFQGLAAKASSLGLKALVLSAENLSRPHTVALLSAAKAYFDCEILYYIRRHDDWLVSSWMQWQFKTGITLDEFADQFLQTRDSIYRRIIEACVEYFSADQLRLRVLFPDNLVGGDLVTDFWSALGVPSEKMQKVKSRNVSHSLNLTNIMKESPYLFDGEHDNALTSFLDDYHQFSAGAKPRITLPRERRLEVLEHFRSEIRWIRKNFFKEDQLKGWLLVRAYPPQEDDKTVTLEGLAEMLNIQLSILKDLREDVDRIKSRLVIR